MYKLEILSKVTDSTTHLENNVVDLTAKEEKTINFEKPWLSSFINLSESQWKELNENGKLEFTTVETKTFRLNKKPIC
jgi:hypothetical protein